MSFFGSLFSAPEIVSKTTDAVIKSGDALFFTEEEKSIANQKKLDWLLKFHEASSGSNLARRYLAVMFTMVFLFLIVMTSVLVLLTEPDMVKDMMSLLTDTLAIPMGMIIAFYFGHGYVKTFAGK